MLLHNRSTVLGSSEESLTQPTPTFLRRQRTLAREVTFAGIGFVSGADVHLRFLPAPVETGYVFRRTDLPGRPAIAAHLTNLLHNDRRTAIGSGDAVVEMTEHVLSALAGIEIDNCFIEIDASETPAADGSCLPFLEVLDRAGTVEQSSDIKPIKIREAIQIIDGKTTIEIHPTTQPGLTVTYEVIYTNPGIGRQEVTVRINPRTFREEVAPARTFVLVEEVDALRSMGIGLRHTARDLIVFAADGSVIDNTLRFRDECARHKILDIVGDLALLGRPVQGHLFARRSGHRHNVELARKILEQAE